MFDTLTEKLRESAMDADAHRRAAQEDDDEIKRWMDQIDLEKRESDIRIQNYRSEIEKRKKSKFDHLEAAKQAERDEAEKRHRMKEAAQHLILGADEDAG